MSTDSWEKLHNQIEVVIEKSKNSDIKIENLFGWLEEKSIKALISFITNQNINRNSENIIAEQNNFKTTNIFYNHNSNYNLS